MLHCQTLQLPATTCSLHCKLRKQHLEVCTCQNNIQNEYLVDGQHFDNTTSAGQYRRQQQTINDNSQQLKEFNSKNYNIQAAGGNINTSPRVDCRRQQQIIMSSIQIKRDRLCQLWDPNSLPKWKMQEKVQRLLKVS